jgi:mediator of RNA polymerase II transcription subunit 10
VEEGLNPDKYTRRFINTLMKDNQFVNGKIDAVQVLTDATGLMQDFRDVLAEEIRKEFPELDEFVEEVIQNTGGKREQDPHVKEEDKDHIVID